MSETCNTHERWMFVQICSYIGGREETIWDMYCVAGTRKVLELVKNLCSVSVCSTVCKLFITERDSSLA
jgi:hypothetical protein